MKRFIIIFTTLFCLAVVPLTVNAKSLEQAVQQVKQQTGGRILSAKTDNKGNHKIKVLLPSGKVKTVKIKE